MLNRNALVLVAGAAIFALDASASIAQDTTRTRPTSSQRIRIGKESPGEVVAPVVRVDTVYQYRTDTLRLPGRADTVVTTNTIVRVDTVQILPPAIAQIGGLYFGLAGGSSLPAANFNDSDKPGWRIEGMLGVDPIGSPLGLRLSGGYGRYEQHSYTRPFKENAQLMNVALDAKLRLVQIAPLNKRVQLYAIGGGTWNRFRDILETKSGVMNVGEAFAVNGQFPTTDHTWHNGFGYNLGGGAEVGFGRTNIFLESRFARFKGENANISHVPVVLGVSWF
jgi:hypothetical protein